VLPLLRPLGRFGSLSALAIGSMAPDLSFIVPTGLSRAQTHEAAALLTYCLPAGLLTYLVFHWVLKVPMLRLFSGRLHAQLLGPAMAPLAAWPAVLVSLLVGAITHQLWDGFTHQGTTFVQALPLLRKVLWYGDGYTFFVYSALQQLSSVAGLLLMALWLRRWSLGSPPVIAASPPSHAVPLSAPSRTPICAALIVIPVLYGLAIAFVENPIPNNARAMRYFFASFIFSALPALAATVLAYAIGSRLWGRLSPP
jgi:hypothetical protein